MLLPNQYMDEYWNEAHNVLTQSTSILPALWQGIFDTFGAWFETEGTPDEIKDAIT